MTIAEALAEADELCPNTVTTSRKKKWLSYLDGRVYYEVLKEVEPNDDETFPDSFTGYSDSTATSTDLLVQYPFDCMYGQWLVAQIEAYNREYEYYNNTMTIFNNHYVDYANFMRRTHKTVQHVENILL